MRKLLVILIACLISAPGFCQKLTDGKDFPRYKVPDEVYLKSSVKLPAKINLAKSKYFPDIFNQTGWSCNQSSSIGYLLTYELNRLRNADGGLPENRYPPLYAWTFLNSGLYGNGVSYFDSWEIIKAGGSPNEVDYPNVTDLNFWMSGYDKYYRAMQNRVLANWSLPVGTPEELQVLKRYLYDHFNGSKFGGMANFQVASGGMSLAPLPKNSYDEGASYITTFGAYVGHALTVVGYNDSIRLDRNDDGEYTNDIDINNDHVIDLKDFEKGALIVANTWGKNWGDNGFAYVPYFLLGYYGWEGGIWNKSVHIVDAVKNMTPILTLRAELSHGCRSCVRLMAGISNDPNATEPEHIIQFPMFNYQGNLLPLYGNGNPDITRFEVGLDISPLLDFVTTDGPVRIFLIVDDKGSWGSGNGTIRSMMVYNDFNTRDSTICTQANVQVNSNSRTLLSVVRPVRFNQIKIKEVPKLIAKAGEYVSVQLEVEGAANPYVWELVPDYQIGFKKTVVPEWGGKLLFNGQSGNMVNRIDLPFKFRFYDKEYDHFSVTQDARILFDQEEYGYPYVIDPSLVFPSIKKIGGLEMALDYYMPGNGISCFANDTILALTWKAMAPSLQGGTAVTIVCELHPDGRICFIYDKPDVLFPSGAVNDIGVSNGDNLQFRRASTFNPDKIEGANCLLINPYLLPGETKFDQTGWLFCHPDNSNKLYEIKVQVTDKNNRKAYSTIRISTQDLSSSRLLSLCFPNPFQEKARFSIIVPEKATVLAEIYDLRGSKVAVLCDGEYIPAEYELGWDGTSSTGSQVSPGVYICRLTVGNRVESCKFIKSK